jgi:V-type H+-transporting ATPase subunit d
MELLSFNVEDGYTEALIRGLRASFLRKEDYDALKDCVNMADFKMVMEETDYLSFIQSEASLNSNILRKKMREKLAREFQHIKSMASPQLNAFLEKSSHRYMIDNVINLIEGNKNREKEDKLLKGIDPLGEFEGIGDIVHFRGEDFSELYHIVLIDSPVGEYFQRYLESIISNLDGDKRTLDQIHKQFNEITPEMLRTSLRKLWIEDMYEMTKTFNPTSREILQDLIKFEADCITIQIIYNSLSNPDLNTQAARESDRKDLCPKVGYLYPDFDEELTDANDMSTLRKALSAFTEYSNMVANVPDPTNVDEMNDPTRQSLDDVMYQAAVRKYSLAFDQQFHYACYYAYLKLKEQEIRNAVYMSEMIPLHISKQDPRWSKYERLIPFFCLLG